MTRTGRAVTVHTTRALLLRKVAHAETHSVVTLLTEELGKVSALARSAGRSQRRFGGGLESLHTLDVRLEEKTGTELFHLAEASIAVVRSRLLESLGGLEAAGQALVWVRKFAPPRQPEPGLWSLLTTLLDNLNQGDRADDAARVELAAFGLGLLGQLGWGFDFERCARCGKRCDPGRAAMFDPARGGIVCRACGGARLYLSAPERTRFLSASLGNRAALLEEDAARVIELVLLGLATHAGSEM